MEEAIRLSIQNVQERIGGPFGAVIVKDGEIIARGTNRVTLDNDPTAHAEVVAIREACKVLGNFQLNNCIIYSSCEPCPMCLSAIFWARPLALYFANSKEDAALIHFDDAFIYHQIVKPLEERGIYTRQMMREEALEAFRLWSSSVDKIEY